MEPERKDGRKAREEHAGQTPASLPESNESAEEFADYRERPEDRTSRPGADPEAEREADLQPGTVDGREERERGREGPKSRP